MNRSGVVVLLLAAAGCRAYEPLGATVPPGEARIRVELSDSGTRSLRDYLGDGVRTVDGLFLRKDSASISLRMLSTTLESGVERVWHGEDVTLPEGLIAHVQLAQISPQKTVGAVTLAAILAAVYFANFRGGGGSGGTVPGGGAPVR
ncbi:MAG: hypothetical protein NVS1B4_04520 [Gemmatimonadaceae bacterium]